MMILVRTKLLGLMKNTHATNLKVADLMNKKQPLSEQPCFQYLRDRQRYENGETRNDHYQYTLT